MAEPKQDMVDAYTSPLSETGTTKSKEQAIADGDWLGGVHLWLYQAGDEPVVFCQLRGSDVQHQPGRLDATAAGHHDPGEDAVTAGIRELYEETGVEIAPDELTSWGRRLYVGLDSRGRECKGMIDIFGAPFAGDLEAFKLQPEELDGMFRLPIKPLLAVVSGQLESFTAQGIDTKGGKISMTITVNSFPRNLDDYHHHMIEYLAIKSGAVA